MMPIDVFVMFSSRFSYLNNKSQGNFLMHEMIIYGNLEHQHEIWIEAITDRYR